MRVHRVRPLDRRGVEERVRHLCARRRVGYGLLGVGGHAGNCEHVARWVVTGVASSEQAAAGLAGAVVVAAGLVLALAARLG